MPTISVYMNSYGTYEVYSDSVNMAFETYAEIERTFPNCEIVVLP